MNTAFSTRGVEGLTELELRKTSSTEGYFGIHRWSHIVEWIFTLPYHYNPSQLLGCHHKAL